MGHHDDRSYRRIRRRIEPGRAQVGPRGELQIFSIHTPITADGMKT
jgi:hypothetical protein